jgi:hypothetical protein
MHSLHESYYYCRHRFNHNQPFKIFTRTSQPQSRYLPRLRKGNTAVFIVGKAVGSVCSASIRECIKFYLCSILGANASNYFQSVLGVLKHVTSTGREHSGLKRFAPEHFLRRICFFPFIEEAIAILINGTNKLRMSWFLRHCIIVVHILWTPSMLLKSCAFRGVNDRIF